jgi:hypothetical protein
MFTANWMIGCEATVGALRARGDEQAVLHGQAAEAIFQELASFYRSATARPAARACGQNGFS